jgi:hypothetical protein
LIKHSRSPDQSRIRKCAERERKTLSSKNDQKSSPVCHPFSMARFWFLLGVTKTQPPGYPHPNSRAPTSNRKSHKTAQLWLRSCLRHPYEARSPLGFPLSNPLFPSLSLERNKKKTVKNRELPAGLPASRFRIFLLIEYPYTTLSSRAGRRLSTHAHLSEYSLSQILQSTGTPPHLSVRRSPASLTHIRVV